MCICGVCNIPKQVMIRPLRSDRLECALSGEDRGGKQGAAMQATVGRQVEFAGVGLHSGRPVEMRVLPAGPDTGIRFVCEDDSGARAEIPARVDHVAETAFRTRLAAPNGAGVDTVEHFMAAAAVLGIDNLRVEMRGGEVPAMDGSAEPFAEKLLAAGLVAQPAPRRVIRVLRKVSVRGERGAAMTLTPASGFRLDCRIEFSNPVIGRSEIQIAGLQRSLVAELLPARTFAELEAAVMMRKAGLGLGGDQSNAILVSKNGVINEKGLRFPDEYVRHKALDVIGDLYLAGAPIQGHCIAERPGHGMTAKVLRELFSDQANWSWHFDGQGAGPRPGFEAAGVLGTSP